MNRTTVYGIALCVIAAAAGCGDGGKDREATQTRGSEVRTEESDTAGDSKVTTDIPRRLPRVRGEILDSLRVKKTRFHITRDQYWEFEGGVLANEYFEVWYPVGDVTVTHGMYVFEELMPARKRFEEFFGRTPSELVVIHCPPDLEVYERDTGREWWYYAEIKGDTITFAPVWILSKRGVSAQAIPHEYYQWAIRKITRGGSPRWLEEGLASYLSGEGDLLLKQVYEFSDTDVSMTPEEIEGVLQGEEDRRDSRVAYYHSYRMVEQLIKTYGEDRFKQAVMLIGAGNTLDQAFMTAVERDYRGALEDATRYSVDLTRKKKS